MYTLYRSPIQMVVSEVLLQIFTQCLLSDDCPTCGTKAIPMIISQVCADWRRLALDSSHLWSSFRVTISTRYPRPPPSFLRLWLRRSASRPLAFCLELDEFPPVRDMAHVMYAKSLFSVLSTRSHLWREIKLLLPGSYDLLQPLSKLVMPQLRTLDLTLRNCHTGDFDAVDCLLYNTPSLYLFSWNNRSTWGRWDRTFEGSFVPNSNWQRLTHLVYNSSISLSALYAILQYCTSLVVCDLRHFGTAETPLVPFDPILLLHLTTLKIYQASLGRELGLFLDSIFTPALCTLSLTCGRVEAYSWPQQLISLLSRSCCKLEALSLECTGITEGELIQCLWTTHLSLRILELYDRYNNVCVGDKLLRLLSRHEDNVVFCPNLVILTLYGVTRPSDSLVTTMLQSKTRYLTSVNLGTANTISVLPREIYQV